MDIFGNISGVFFIFFARILSFVFAGSPSGKLGLWLRLASSGVSYSTNSLRKQMGHVIFCFIQQLASRVVRA